MKRIFLTIAIIFGVLQMTGAVGTMTSVYLNPIGGNDSNAGTLTYPVQSWDKALQLAANNATIYMAWGAVPVTSNMTINGNQYGATNITVEQNSGYTGALFAIADGATATFSNITLKGSGTAHALITVNSGGTLTIGNSVAMTNEGQVALDGGANAINLTATPVAGTKFPLLTTYLSATDEGRAIVNAGSVSNPLQYFTLVTPVSTSSVAYELGLDGTTIRLYEHAVAGIYLDPLNGNDAYSGAKSSRPVKTLAKATAIWNDRSPVVSGIAIHILTRVTLTEDLTLDNGIKFIRFAGDSDRSTTMTDYLFVYTGYEVTINNATITNSLASSPTGVALYSASNGILTLNNGATLTSANSDYLINTLSYGTTTMNAGATVTCTGSGGFLSSNTYSHFTMNGGTITHSGTSYCIYGYSYCNITVHGGSITTNGTAIYKYYGTLLINDVTITHNGSSNCIYNYYGTATIHDATITTKGSNAIYNTYGTTTINDIDIKNERASVGYTITNAGSGSMTINGGTIDAGITTAVYSTSTSGITINKADIYSSNTTTEAIYSTYTIRLNGENVKISGGGAIYMNSISYLESRYILITSPTVTQDYILRIAPGTIYTALVRSSPSIDLGLYENKFTLKPIDGYLLAAYANKNAGNKNMVLYNPNGVYVNDFFGSDSNNGSSPTTPVKTLANAAGKTTAAKTLIYICDSTLTINSTQNISQSAVKDTITSFMFRTANTSLMRITTGGSLTLGNIGIYCPSTYITRIIQIDDGTLALNSNAELMTYYTQSTARYGIYQTGGNVVMNNGSLIKGMPTSVSFTSYMYGIYVSGSTAALALETGSMIKDQQYGIQFVGTSQVEIKDSAVITYVGYPIQITGAGTLNIGKARLEGTSSRTSNYPVITANNGTTTLNGTLIRNGGYRALSLSGTSTVVNMNDGQIINNGIQGTYSSSSYAGAVYISGQATFNMYDGKIENNNIPSATNNDIFGEQVYITSGGQMNFLGGTIAASHSERNAVYVHAESTSAVQQTTRLTLSNTAVLDSGFIYCRNPYNAPLALSETLSPTKKFNINLGDIMAGCTVVDGTSTGNAASVNNFVLNPALTTLSLAQSNADVVVGSTAIYLDGTNGIDTNDGSSAALAVKTFKRARERLQATGGDVIVVINSALLSNADEISNWDLSFKPGAVVQRGLGYTGYLVQITSGKTLTLSDITFDGNKDNFVNSTNAIIYNNYGTLTINSGTIIKDNRNHGVYSYYGPVYMNGGSIQGHISYGVYVQNGSYYMTGGAVTQNSSYGVSLSSSSSRSDEFIMTGGSISENNNYGLYTSYVRNTRITGGEISRNKSIGIFSYYNVNTAVLEIGGTAKINENSSGGIRYNYSTTYTGDSLIISGGEINNNLGYGIYSISANHFSITGGTISNNTNYGIQATHSNTSSGTSFSAKNATISSNNGYGINISNYSDVSFEDIDIRNNTSYGVHLSGNTITNPCTFTMSSGKIDNNGNYGLYLNNSYLTYDLSGNAQITNNKNCGIYSNSLLPSSISEDVLIKGNKTSNYGGGLYVNQGTVNVSDNVLFEADTCGYGGGAIYVAVNGNAVISGNVRIKDCYNSTTSTSASYGGSAIYSLGKLSMTGGSITGCQAPNSGGTVFVYTTTSDVNLTRVRISDNTARYGGAIYVYSGGRITLDTDTIINNTSAYLTSYATPVTGNIHIAGGGTGRLSLRDKNQIEGDLYLASTTDTIYIDEALLNADIGEFHLLGQTTNGTNGVMTLGKVVVSPNATTVTDASQFLTKFTLMNANTGRGLDKGGLNDKHIMIVNQFFIDGTKADGGSGSNPLTAFNKFSDLVSRNILASAYTTVWVSGPVFVTGTDVLPTITTNNVNLRRYTGFAVAAQPFEAYDSVMITVNPGASLTIPGGNSAANRFTISGEGGSGLTDASIFKNNGTLTIGGYTYLYFNPIAGNGSAIYQNGTLNLSGNIEFELHSTNTVYLAEDKVINITNTFNPPNPIGITVETSPTNTQIPGRIIATGTTTNVPVGAENLFYNELSTPHLPIGRAVNGTTANLMFYIADRNVTGVPIYTSLQDAFDASIAANNDEVRLYGNTEEAVTVDKKLRYNSQGFEVVGSFTLDSTSSVQLLDELLADTLYIRATTFSNKAQLDLNTQDVTIAKAAYLDLRLPEGIIISDWYPVNLPFNANVAEVRNADDTTALMLHLQDYAVATFDGQQRANYGIGNQPSNPDNDWQYFTGSQMTNGTGYMVTTKGIQALRFKAANLNLFATTTAPMTYYVGSAGNPHRGFNYIPMPMPINSTVAAGIPNGGLIQVSEDLSSDRIGAASYVGKTVSASLVVAPYTNYFYQTTANGTVSYTKSTAAATVRSGQAITYGDAISSEVPAYYELRFYADNPERYDAFFAAASEYASEGDYEIGRDVAKMGTVGQGAMQIWSKDFDVALCANEVKLKNSSADIPLFIHTPVAGKEYTLKLNNVVSYNEQLWLCRAGKLVQNLTLYREYIIEGTGDTTEEYSLRFLSGTTANEPTGTGEIYVYTENKTIVIVGLQPGDDYLIFDTAGRLHKSGKADSNRTRISAGSGTYVIQTKTNDKTFKAIVK